MVRAELEQMARRKGLHITIHITFYSIIWCFGINWDQFLCWNLYDTFLCLWKHPTQKLLVLLVEKIRSEQLYRDRTPKYAVFPFGIPRIKLFPSNDKGTKPYSVLLFYNYQAVWQTEQLKCVIMITKQHRNDGACNPEEVCLLQADTVESHRVIAVSLLPIFYCPWIFLLSV